jgi:hypothetical protein
MKLIKSLLLGTAAGFAATAGVQAADLPSKKAAPVDYVRVCTIGSFTGFVIPGSDVCLKVGGFVRWQYTYNQPQSQFTYVPGVGGFSGARGFGIANGSGQVVQGSVKLDARTTTEYGLLRSFADMRLVAGSGALGGAQTVNLDKAYIQFGPWSFGRFQSFFDFYADAYNNLGALGSDTTVNGAAYTFNAGNGFFATIALEDRGNAGLGNVATIPFADPALGGPGIGFGGVGTAAALGINNGGYRVPDAVVQFLYDPGAGGWGSAQLTAAVHQARIGYNATGATFFGGGTDIGDTKYGWAVQGGVKFNLGMLGAGDSMYVQAAYAQGAASYLGTTSGLTGNNTTNYLVASDAIAVGPAGSLKLGEGYNVLAAIDHYWAPNFDTALWAGYTRWDYNNGALTGVALAAPYASTFAQARDFDVWQVGVQATWVPVKGIKFAGTVNYYNVNAQKAAQDFIVSAGVPVYVGNSKNDGIQAALRIQRDF